MIAGAGESILLGVVGVCNMYNERIVGGPTLRLIYFSGGIGACGIAAKAVNSFGGENDQATAAQNIGCFAQHVCVTDEIAYRHNLCIQRYLTVPLPLTFVLTL
jgi:hypothetical protein